MLSTGNARGRFFLHRGSSHASRQRVSTSQLLTRALNLVEPPTTLADEENNNSACEINLSPNRGSYSTRGSSPCQCNIPRWYLEKVRRGNPHYGHRIGGTNARRLPRYTFFRVPNFSRHATTSCLLAYPLPLSSPLDRAWFSEQTTSASLETGNAGHSDSRDC